MFSYCTGQSKAPTSPPRQPPGYKFPIHVWGNYKVCVIYANPPWHHNLSLCNHLLVISLCPATSSKTYIHYMYHVKLKLRFKFLNPWASGYQISHHNENYDNQISSTTEQKSVKCPGYAQEGEGRGVLKLQFGRYEEEKFLIIFTEVILTLYAQGFWC